MSDAEKDVLPAHIAAVDAVDKSKLQPLGRPADWLPAGEVSRAFVLAPDPVSCIMGPYGSGKTTAAFVKGLLCSCVVPRSPVDGVRYARGIVVRDTYRNLEMNTLPSWFERFPPELGSFKGGGGGEPGKAVIDFELTPGEVLHLEVIFVALGEMNVKTFCDGLQGTWCFANGIDALPREFISFMRPRLGRWPAPQHRPEDWRAHVHRWRKLFGDMNAPDIDNWTYGDAEKKRPGFVDHVPPGWKLYTQPGGTDPKAENKENLPTDYYDTLIAENETWWVNRFVHNKFGYSRAGEPVYNEYNDTLHVADRDLEFDPFYPLEIGADGGRDACAIVLQRLPRGFVNILDELVPNARMGAKQFAKELSEWLASRFPDATEFRGHCDPACANPNDLDDDATWMEIVSEITKIPFRAAPSNVLTVRLEAVRQPLTELIDGKPRVRISPRCRVLRRGFNSGYRYAKTKTAQGERVAADPLKNDYSHPHDALQYGMLGSSDYRELKGRGARKRKSQEEFEHG